MRALNSSSTRYEPRWMGFLGEISSFFFLSVYTILLLGVVDLIDELT